MRLRIAIATMATVAALLCLPAAAAADAALPTGYLFSRDGAVYTGGSALVAGALVTVGVLILLWVRRASARHVGPQ